MNEKYQARRSWLIVPSALPEMPSAYPCQPDVLVFDLEYSVAPKDKEQARLVLPRLIRQQASCAAEIFVRVTYDTRWADVRAAVTKGLNGIVLCGPEDPAEIAEIAQRVTELEQEHQLPLQSIELVLMFETAKGFWNAEALARASSRVTTLGVGRIDLTMMLGIVPNNEFRLYRFLMTRTLLAARMLGKQPLGAFWRPGSRGGVASVEETFLAANEARLLGFEGCLCAKPEQVEPVRQGFARRALGVKDHE